MTDDNPIVQRAWRLAPKQLEVLDSHINKLLEAGVIYPCHDSNYSAVCVLVKKPGRSNELRVTTDFRRLNVKCLKHAFMSPTAKELFTMTDGADTFSVVDVHSAFYCMEVRKEDQHKLCFATPHRGNFAYARMAQGFCNSPAWLGAGFLKMLMEPIPGPCDEFPDDVGPRELWGKPAMSNLCCHFVDDICIFGKAKYHAGSVRFVFKLMQKCNLSLRPDKFSLGQKQVKYLGVQLCAENGNTVLRVDPGKVKALHEAPKPTDVPGVRRFMGQITYHRDWIKHFSSRTKIMTDLLKKGVKFEWTETHDAEYDDILKELTSDTCLHVFSWSADVVLQTDACATGFGAHLINVMPDGTRKTICYANKRLNDTEAKRCARDLECGALCWGVSKFRPFLLHKPWVAKGDHQPLLWLKQYSGNNRRLYNYSLCLSDYDFTYKWVPCRTLDTADYCSRHPGPLSTEVDPHHPDQGIDPECGTDMVSNPIGDGCNLIPSQAPQVDVSERTKPKVWARSSGIHQVTSKVAPIKSVHVVFHRPDKNGRTEVLVGKETKFGRRGQLNVPGGKSEEGETPMEAAKREAREEAGVELGFYRLGTPSKLRLTNKNVEYGTHIFLVSLEAGQDVTHLPRGEGRNPLSDVRWRRVSELTDNFNTSQVLRWACQQRLVENHRPAYVEPSQVRPPYFAPYYGRDVLCKCKPKCDPAGSDTDHGRAGYQCKSVHDNVTAHRGLYTEKQRWGQVVGIDSMATAHAADLTVTVAAAGTTKRDVQVAKLHAQRTGIDTIPTWQEWWKGARSDDPQSDGSGMDVLAVTANICVISRTRFSTVKQTAKQSSQPPTLMETIPEMAKLLQPRVVMVEVMPVQSSQRMHKPAGDQHYELEKALHAIGYNVDARYVNGAEVGGLISEQTYWIVAHKVEETAMEWPVELEQLGGLQHILQTNADVRLRRDDYTKTRPKFTGMFQAEKVGYSQGGGTRRDRDVHSYTHPLPPIEKYYDPITRENGGGCITEPKGGARVMTQTELMAGKGLTKAVSDQLREWPGADVQPIIASTPCVTTRTAIYGGVLKLVELGGVCKMETRWGDQPTPASACHKTRMSNDHYVHGCIATRQCNYTINGVLQHTTMPSFREIRHVQRKDPKLVQLHQYIVDSLKNPNYDACTKDTTKLKAAARMKLDPEYRRYAEYFRISDGAIMFRDELNDEWLTDAIVLPESLVNTAMEAFHDSGYGGHLGAHKTKVAMQERVWFPHLGRRVKDYCTQCGARAQAKVSKAQHAGAMKSPLYCEQFEYWAMDLQGAYLPGADGMKYHMHMVDLTTHYNVSIAIPDKNAKTVSDALHEHLILKFGAPKTILSDLGTEFTAEITQELLKSYGVKCLHSTAAHPTGNALVERGHRVYNAIMRTLLHKYGMDWTATLPYACWCLNAHAISGTNISPYEMVFGKKPMDPNTANVTRSNV